MPLVVINRTLGNVPDIIFQGPRQRFLILGTSPAIFSLHGNSRDFLYGNRPPWANLQRELAATGNLPAGTSHCLRGWGVGALKPHAEHGPF